MGELTSEQAKKILTANEGFSTMGFSLLITRLRLVYKKNPSPASLANCTNEMNQFINKYSMILGADFSVIDKICG